MKVKTNVTDLFHDAVSENTYVKICAPMVRYSKVHFRTLVKNYGVDLCFSPMILADSFCQNEKARRNEFNTTVNDTPLIVQFAANNRNDFLDATQLVCDYADGVDLNCGCPQKWAMKDGYGCALLSKPEVIYDIVKEVRNKVPHNFSVSVKMRLLKDLKKTIGICQQLEQCGVNFLTVHARTQEQKSTGDVDICALKNICESVNIPIVANGGVKTLSYADNMHIQTGCKGVMAAGGMLTNPSLFSGTKQTPLSCVKLWRNMKDKCNDKITFQCYHHHLVFMLEKILSKEQKIVFNHLGSFDKVDKFLDNHVLNVAYDFDIAKYKLEDFITCSFSEEIVNKHSNKCRGCSKSLFYCKCVTYDYSNCDGLFFKSYTKTCDDLDYMDSNIFDETIQ